MSQKNDFSDIFDDDFEVTYEEDPEINFQSSGNTKPINRQSSGSDTMELDDDNFEEVLPEYEDDYDDEYEDYDNYENEDDYNSRDSRRSKSDPYNSRNSRRKDPYDDRDYDRRSSRRKRSGGGVKLAAPIKKGGRALSKLTSALLQQLSVVLILVTTIFVLYNFYRASTPYGDIPEAIQKQKISQTLAAYLCVAAIFLFFEFISLLWTMTRVRVRNGIDTWREDTGRGLWSFILVFAVSYLSFLFSPMLPDSPEVVYGVKGALDVYGSLHNVLFGLCAAGVISCLIRKYKNSN